MLTTKKTKIEAIYPLSYMQVGLLFHHLSSGWDQGFLNVVCDIRGALSTSDFEKAWEHAVKRHTVLRTTVHWANLEKPVQIVHQEKAMDVRFLDWTKYSGEEREIEWEKLEHQSRETGSNLMTGALQNITVIKFENESWRLLWPSHHILLDGWSSQIILDDVLTFHNAIQKEETPNLETLPTHKSYLTWLGNLDATAAHDFWSQYFNEFDHASLFNTNNKTADVSKPLVKKDFLSKTDTENLQAFAKNQRVTVNTVVQGVWGLILNRYFDQNDLAFGTVVSGRSIDFPNIQFLSGMFMNVQPVRFTVDHDLTFSEWLNAIQKQQLEARKYEHIGLDKITSYINWPSSRPLFDSLLLFENYPHIGSSNGNLKIVGFRSGLTSTYPVTMVVVPGEKIELDLSVLSEIVDEKSASWILESIKKILNAIVHGNLTSVGQLLSSIEVFKGNFQKGEKTNKKPSAQNYNGPSNKIEQQLTKIWQNLFNLENIGVNNNYFELGGKSLMAIGMFSEIEKQFQKKLSPTLLLFHPTIRSLANKIGGSGNGDISKRKYLVPLRTTGHNQPLFCFHGGEGHILFYMLLPDHIDKNRPVYAVQPKGINGDEPMHSNIEEMCTDYLKEVEAIQSTGTYNLLFYCYNAIAVEISNQLAKKGKQSNIIVVDSTVGPGASMIEQKLGERLDVYLKKILKTPFSTIGNSIKSRVRYHFPRFYNVLARDTVTKNLIKIKKQLDDSHNIYDWKKFNSPCALILTQNEHPKLRQKKINAWKEWCQSDVKVLLNSGNHFNQFEEPHVKTLGQYVEDAII